MKLQHHFETSKNLKKKELEELSVDIMRSLKSKVLQILRIETKRDLEASYRC